MTAPSERVGWKQEPTGEMVLGFLQSYLLHHFRKTRGTRDEVLAPMQYSGKPTERRAQGGAVVGGLLELNDRLTQGSPLDVSPDDSLSESLKRGQEVFRGLDDPDLGLRTGVEGIVQTDLIDIKYNLANASMTPELRLAKLALAGMQDDKGKTKPDWARARTTFNEAAAALQLAAANTPAQGETAA